MNDLLNIFALGSHSGKACCIERGIRTLTRGIQTSWNGEYLSCEQAISKIKETYCYFKPSGDCITYVPSHDGSDGPSMKLAFLLADVWRIPVKQMIIRNRKLRSAYTSSIRPSKDQQQESMALLHSESIDPLNIILVDNVISSGASIAAAMSVLLTGGYKLASIYCLTIEDRLFRKENIEKNIRDRRIKINYIL